MQGLGRSISFSDNHRRPRTPIHQSHSRSKDAQVDSEQQRLESQEHTQSTPQSHEFSSEGASRSAHIGTADKPKFSAHDIWDRCLYAVLFRFVRLPHAPLARTSEVRLHATEGALWPHQITENYLKEAKSGHGIFPPSHSFGYKRNEIANSGVFPLVFNLSQWDPRFRYLTIMDNVFDHTYFGQWVYEWHIHLCGISHAFAVQWAEIWKLLGMVSSVIHFYDIFHEITLSRRNKHWYTWDVDARHQLKLLAGLIRASEEERLDHQISMGPDGKGFFANQLGTLRMRIWTQTTSQLRMDFHRDWETLFQSKSPLEFRSYLLEAERIYPGALRQAFERTGQIPNWSLLEQFA